MTGRTLSNFILFEGMDGSGQDTQADLLADWFHQQGKTVWRTNEPTDTHMGFTIRKILKGELPKPDALTFQRMYVADRKRHLTEIRQHLDLGVKVVCVRYIYSTLVYGVADGGSYEQLLEMNENLPRPEAAFYLDLTPELAMGRLSQRTSERDLFERKEFLELVHQQFLLIVSKFPELRLVDASADRAVVHQRVLETVLVPQ